MLLRITIPARPVPKSHELVKDPASGKRRMATSGRAHRFQSEVRLLVRSELNRLRIRKPAIPEGPVFAVVTFRLPRPKSGLHRTLPLPTAPPDLDNLLKTLWDGCKLAVYTDDAQIVDQRVRKLWASPEHPVGVELLLADLGAAEELFRSQFGSGTVASST
jgi:Holliday junction resolvase RusA-like endonuclease